MKLPRLLITAVSLVAVSAVAGAVWYRRLPDPVPTHFAMGTVPDGFTSRPVAAFVTPVVVAVLALGFALLPRVAPRRYRLEPFLRVYEIIAITVLVVEFVDGMVGLQIALGHPVSVDRAGSLGLGVLLLVVGNFLGKVTRNFFVGIRTPWTLASAEVWRRTHRVGGVVFVAGGLAILIMSVAGSGGPAGPIAVIVGLALFVTVYSYLLYRRIEGGRALPRPP